MSKTDSMHSGCDVCDWAVPGVQNLKPYVPGKPIADLEREYGVSNVLKLASNENPLGASPAAVSAMTSELQDLWLYPDGGGFELRNALAERHGVKAENITLGNGSNDVLVLLAETFLEPGRQSVFSQYCFMVYPIVTQAAGAEPIIVAANSADHDQPLGHDLDAMLSAIGPDTRMVFIANPNNPTGTWVEEGPLRRFLDAVPEDVLVIVDEAYHEYGSVLGVPDASQWISDYPNLVVCRTFSKAYGLAGIRVGYAVSSSKIGSLLNRLRQPFNVNSLALSGALAGLQDYRFIEETLQINTQGLAQLSAGLNDLGVKVIPSAGNFLLADFGRDVQAINESLMRKGVIVRPVANYGLPTWLRITVGLAEQNERLISSLQEALS